MRERKRSVIGQDRALVIDRQRGPEAGEADQRGERRPAVGRDHRQAAGAPQVFGEQRGEQQQAGRGEECGGDHHVNRDREHPERQGRRAGDDQPKHQLDRPHRRQRPARGDRQQLHRRADRGRGQHAQGEQVDRGERRPRSAAEARRLLGAGEQRDPHQHVEDRGRGEEPQRNRCRQQPALGAAEKGGGERHGPQRTMRSCTSPGQPGSPHEGTSSWLQPRSSSSG